MKTILRHRKAIALCVSVIVALSTTYALILPAITVSVEEAREMGGIDVGPAEEEAVAAAEDAAEEEPDAILTDGTTEEAIETAEQEEAIAEETADAGEAVEVLSEEEQQEVLAEEAVQTEEAVAAEEVIPLTGSVYAHSLNIRAEKSLEADIVGTLEDTEIVTILNDAVDAVDEEQEIEINSEEAEFVEEPAVGAEEEIADGWLHIQKNDGTEGYVKDEYIILENETVEEKRPAVSFAETVGAVSVSVEAPVGAFPAGTTMTVTPVAQEDIMEAVQSVVEDNIKTVSAVDITFTDPLGDEIEPYGEIKVSMSSTEMAEAEEQVVVHVDDEGTAAVVESQKEEEQVVFAADSFSVYVIVEKEVIETTVLTADGSTYKITVDVSGTTNIPRDAALEAKELVEGTDEYEEYFNKTSKEIDKDMTLSFARFFDIEIRANGEKIEPDAPVQISIEYIGGTDITGSAAIGIIHFADDGVELIDEVTTDIDGSQMKSIEYMQDSLSVIGTIGTSGYTSLDSVADQMFVIYTQKNNTPYALTHTYGDYYEGDDITTSSPSVLVGADIDSLVVWHAEAVDGGYSVYYEDLDESARRHYLVVDANGTLGDSKTEMTIWSSESGYLKYQNGSNDGYLSYDSGSLITTESISAATQIFFATVEVNDPYLDDGIGPVLRAANLRAANDAPAHSKTLTPNGDGTYTLALSVTGATSGSSHTEVTKANVILVLDTSSSMNSNRTTYNGQRMTRLNAEKHVLTDDDGIIDSLLAQNVPGDSLKSDIIEVAVVDFGTRGTTQQSFTTNAGSLKTTINGLNYSTGTNWEEGLMRAQELATSIKSSQPDEEVYVIFLTDGEPTTHYNDYSVNTNYAQEWAQANDNARAIVTAGHHFYGIFTWGSGNSSHYLSSLVNYAYTGSGNSSTELDSAYAQYFTDATDTETLINALKQITHDITESVGYTNVEIEDGVTTMTTSSVKTTASGTVTGLKYYRSGGPYDSTANNGLGEEWTDAPPATINDDGEVDWNLGNLVLENGVTYTVTFVVWPSQESFDLVADLNNGLEDYDSLTDDQKSQISVSGGKYHLKTNTDYPTVTYSTITTTTVDGEPTVVISDPKETTIPNPDPVDLSDATMTVEKKWDDSLDPKQREGIDSVSLDLMKGDDVYLTDIVLNKENDWKLENYVTIAPGIMVTPDSPAYDEDAVHVTYDGITYAVLESGHDYIFVEEDIDDNYELTAYTHHPMMVNGDLRYVTFTYDSAGNITGVENIYDDATLSATNTLRGGININKTVKDQADSVIEYDGLFTAQITLTPPANPENIEDYWVGSGSDRYSIGKVAWFYYIDESGQRIRDAALKEAGILDDDGNPAAGTEVNYDGGGWFYLWFQDYSTGEAMHNATGTFFLSTEYPIRFTNMAAGTGYSLEETDTQGMTASIEYSHTDASGAPVEDENIVLANTANNIDVTNTTKSAEIQLLKIGDGQTTNTLDGVKFKLYSDEDCTEQITKDALGNDIGATETIDGVEHQAVLTTDADGKLSFGTLIKGQYYLQEIVTKDGYNLLSENIAIDVREDKVVYGSSMTEAKYEDGVYTITVNNSSGKELPMTGGSGTLPYTLGGLMLVMASALMYGFRMRRRERRLN